MSHLHIVQASIEDVARHFRAEAPEGLVIPADTVEGCPGLVVIERDGRRHLRSFSWGFPRHDRERVERGDPPARLVSGREHNEFGGSGSWQPVGRLICPSTRGGDMNSRIGGDDVRDQ